MARADIRQTNSHLIYIIILLYQPFTEGKNKLRRKYHIAILYYIVGFYGNQRNKGRVLTIAFVISSLGSLCMYLPHFLTEPYQWGQGNTHVCSTTGMSIYTKIAYMIIKIARVINNGPSIVRPTTTVVCALFNKTNINLFLYFIQNERVVFYDFVYYFHCRALRIKVVQNTFVIELSP